MSKYYESDLFTTEYEYEGFKILGTPFSKNAKFLTFFDNAYEQRWVLIGMSDVEADYLIKNNFEPKIINTILMRVSGERKYLEGEPPAMVEQSGSRKL